MEKNPKWILEVRERNDEFLKEGNVKSIYAYNAQFDCRHLPELQTYEWIDIMKIAAYRQHNKFIPDNVECCKTGRIKSGYSVENILNMLRPGENYKETHNAYNDVHDELRIIELLGIDLQVYRKHAIINEGKM